MKLSPPMEKINTRLREHYAGFPFDDDLEEPTTQLTTDIGALYDEELPNEVAWAEYICAISKLDCFTYRAIARQPDGTALYWNSLEQSYKEFANNALVIVYQAHEPYPTTDMIKAWCNHQRNEYRT